MTTLPRTELGHTGLPISRFILGTGALGGMAATTGPAGDDASMIHPVDLSDAPAKSNYP